MQSETQQHIERTTRVFSDSTLQEMHNAISRGLATEDALPAGAVGSHGFREHPDFRWQADAIERELARRNKPVTPIAW